MKNLFYFLMMVFGSGDQDVGSVIADYNSRFTIVYVFCVNDKHCHRMFYQHCFIKDDLVDDTIRGAA